MALNYYRSAKPLIAAHRGLSSLYPGIKLCLLYRKHTGKF